MHVESEMNFLNRGLACLLVLLANLLIQAHPAGAIGVNTTTFNGMNFNLITDDRGNEWLSLLATGGMSYFTVSSNIDGGVGDFANYRFATQSEVLALFNDYGAPNIDAGLTVANLPAAQALEADFGPTGGNPFETQTWGYTSDIQPGFPSIHVSPLVAIDSGGGGVTKASFATDLNVNIFFGPNPEIRGSWLILNPPPAVPALSRRSQLGLVLILATAGFIAAQQFESRRSFSQ